MMRRVSSGQSMLNFDYKWLCGSSLFGCSIIVACLLCRLCFLMLIGIAATVFNSYRYGLFCYVSVNLPAR